MTYREAAYSVQKDLKQHGVNADIRLTQVVYWLQVTANKLNSRLLNKRKEGYYVSIFDSVPIEKENGVQVIEFPCAPLALNYDSGISFISYNFDTGTCKRPGFTWTKFSRTTAAQADMLYHPKYERPSPKNPYYYMARTTVDDVQTLKCFLLGTETVTLEDVKMGVYCQLSLKAVSSLSDEIPVPGEMEAQLIRDTLQLGRYLLLIPEERKMDGEETVDKGYAPSTLPQQQQTQEAEQ